MLSETLDSEGLFHCDLGSFRKTNWRAPSTAFAMGPTGAGLTFVLGSDIKRPPFGFHQAATPILLCVRMEQERYLESV